MERTKNGLNNYAYDKEQCDEEELPDFDPEVEIEQWLHNGFIAVDDHSEIA